MCFVTQTLLNLCLFCSFAFKSCLSTTSCLSRFLGNVLQTRFTGVGKVTPREIVQSYLQLTVPRGGRNIQLRVIKNVIVQSTVCKSHTILFSLKGNVIVNVTAAFSSPTILYLMYIAEKFEMETFAMLLCELYIYFSVRIMLTYKMTTTKEVFSMNTFGCQIFSAQLCFKT